MSTHAVEVVIRYRLEVEADSPSDAISQARSAMANRDSIAMPPNGGGVVKFARSRMEAFLERAAGDV